jgi:hypothetical protein
METCCKCLAEKVTGQNQRIYQLSAKLLSRYHELTSCSCTRRCSPACWGATCRGTAWKGRRGAGAAQRRGTRQQGCRAHEGTSARAALRARRGNCMSGLPTPALYQLRMHGPCQRRALVLLQHWRRGAASASAPSVPCRRPAERRALLLLQHLQLQRAAQQPCLRRLCRSHPLHRL